MFGFRQGYKILYFFAGNPSQLAWLSAAFLLVK